MNSDKITHLHGGGGKAMGDLLSEILPAITLRKTQNGIGLDEMDDAAVIPIGGKNIVFTTDSYVVKPIFFPGGDIGKLSICGTINDLAVMGAKPVAISLSFIIGDGFPIEDLKRIVVSISDISQKEKVAVVTGDTKVIEDNIGIIINTSGIGEAPKVIGDSGLKMGDKIIISGTIGDHGIAVMSKREGIKFETELKSDCAPLYSMIAKILSYDVHAMKDPTRGGLANTLNELAEKSGKEILMYEDRIPIRDDVKAASEMLGLDPLNIANEGKVVIGVSKEDAEDVLKELKKTEEGKNAAIIGEAVGDSKHGSVILETLVGGKRILEKPLGDPVPRVC